MFFACLGIDLIRQVEDKTVARICDFIISHFSVTSDTKLVRLSWSEKSETKPDRT